MEWMVTGRDLANIRPRKLAMFRPNKIATTPMRATPAAIVQRVCGAITPAGGASRGIAGTGAIGAAVDSAECADSGSIEVGAGEGAIVPIKRYP